MRRLWLFLLLLVAGAAAAAMVARGGNGGPAPSVPSPRGAASAVFAGGCFWSVEKAFEEMPGVVSATSGFSGGRGANPSYDQVVGGGTGHLEAVRVVYDPARIGYAALVARFLRTIDPTDPAGQFCDRGDQYRTAIFTGSSAERRAAEAALAEAGRQLGARITTQVRAASAFYPAEAYHQDFARRNSVRYALYARGCGREARLRQVWGRRG
ncbi:peptide-methionine (S)-S-oxide reductase MsrA [Sphingosinicella terrae]|uniref:peptide-methionine (S)-S-oxide reductase MsrA n=1 Tax=Sphingosinicella terrae TaxID=2172047 RepID=UPI000E0CF088|nr:peptide-methionine (S)-S-oxide reductase MsrA [Sphingosinicella terrae]